MAMSNSEILLVVMLEDKEALAQLKEIASIDGLDLIGIGPSDLSQSLGVTDSRDPKLKSAVEEISLTIRKVGKARMGFPLKHPAFPLNVAELQRLGVAYSNCAPSDVERLLRSYREQVQEVKAQMG